MAERHGFLDRCALLLHACGGEAPTADDEARLARNGIKSSVLRKDPDSEVRLYCSGTCTAHGLGGDAVLLLHLYCTRTRG